MMKGALCRLRRLLPQTVMVLALVQFSAAVSAGFQRLGVGQLAATDLADATRIIAATVLAHLGLTAEFLLLRYGIGSAISLHAMATTFDSLGVHTVARLPIIRFACQHVLADLSTVGLIALIVGLGSVAGTSPAVIMGLCAFAGAIAVVLETAGLAMSGAIMLIDAEPARLITRARLPANIARLLVFYAFRLLTEAGIIAAATWVAIEIIPAGLSFIRLPLIVAGATIPLTFIRVSAAQLKLALLGVMARADPRRGTLSPPSSGCNRTLTGPGPVADCQLSGTRSREADISSARRSSR